MQNRHAIGKLGPMNTSCLGALQIDTSSNFTTNTLLRVKKKLGEGGKIRAATWKGHLSASQSLKQHASIDFLKLDKYLRGSQTRLMENTDLGVCPQSPRESKYLATIVVAINNPAEAEAISATLQQAQFKVVICLDGRQVMNEVIEKHEERMGSECHQPVDCLIIEKDLHLQGAIEVTKELRGFERGLRKKESAALAASGKGNPPSSRRVPVICCSHDSNPEDLRAYMRADMDGCISLPIVATSLLNTVRAAVPHHLAEVTTRNTALPNKVGNDPRIFRLGPMGTKEGGNDSSALAMRSLATTKSKEDECAYSGLAQLDSDTLLPFTVMDLSRRSGIQIKQRSSVFNLVVCHDLFDTAERMKIFLKPLITKYAGIQVLLWNYPGQAFTEWRSEQLLNNEYHAICLNELLGQVGHNGTNDFDTSQPFFILGYGHGMSVATFYAAHYNIPNLRGVIGVNGWSFLDSHMAGVMHDCINIFECAPPTRPDLPVYFFSRFLFSKDYLARASVPLALNIYTAVHNPISIAGRVSLCKGVLQMIDTRAVLSELDRALISIHAMEDSLARPSHAEAFILNRGGEATSIHQVLQEPSKSCIIWMKGGHELFQERRGDLLLLLEQILTGFHEEHNIPVAQIDEPLHKSDVKISYRSLGVAVEDRFINNMLQSLHKVNKDQAAGPRLGNIPAQVGTSSPTAKIEQMGDIPRYSSQLAQQVVSEGISSNTSAWQDYSRKISETQFFTGKRGEAKRTTMESSETLIVLDPTSALFDRQSSNKQNILKDSLVHKMNASEFTEVKEYMSWRLKRNKRRLQRLQNAAKIIQRAFRCYISRRRATQIRRARAAAIIQRYFRGWLGRCQFLHQARRLWAAQTVQL